MPLKVTFRRGRKIGDPGYGSTDVGLEFSMEVEDEIFNDDATFAQFCATNYSFAEQLLDAEIKRIYAARPAPVETAAQRDEHAREHSHAASTNGNGRSNGYHDGDREIDRARQRDDRPHGAAIGDQGYRNGNGAATKPRHEWDRRGDRPPDRDDRDRPRDDRGGRRDDRRDDRRGGGGNRGGGYGRPRNGKGLFAWAKDHEERGARGFLKKLQGWCKERFGSWRFDELTEDEVRETLETGERMIEDAGGY